MVRKVNTARKAASLNLGLGLWGYKLSRWELYTVFFNAKLECYNQYLNCRGNAYPIENYRPLSKFSVPLQKESVLADSEAITIFYYLRELIVLFFHPETYSFQDVSSYGCASVPYPLFYGYDIQYEYMFEDFGLVYRKSNQSLPFQS